MSYPPTLYKKYTSNDLNEAIKAYNDMRYTTKKQINLSEEEINKLLTKINSIEKQLVDQKITPQKVKEQGTFTDEFTTKSGSSFNSQLPMDFIKENHVYYPTFLNLLNNTLMIGIEVIIPAINSKNYFLNTIDRGVLCYLQIYSNTGIGKIMIAAIKDNGWSAYATEDNGIYVLNLGGANTGFLNWDKNPLENK